MADDAMMVESSSVSESAAPNQDTAATGTLAYLNADWINQQVVAVATEVTKILDSIIDGMLATGYAPFESPVTDDMLSKMTPEQFRTFYDTVPTEEGKANLFARMQALKLPTRELLPPVHATPPIAPAPHLAFTGLDKVPFQGSSV